MHNVEVTAQQIARIIAADPSRQVVLTHGNGPQAGNLALQQDLGRTGGIPAQPFDIVGAMTQGQIGYMFQNRLQTRLQQANITTPVIALINQVLVDRNDIQFQGENASKPVGNFLSEEEAMQMRREKGWIVKCVKPSATKPWRRVVPSPDPIRNVEADTIRGLVERGVIVIASGGGGIPVISDGNGGYTGVEAVIDKDLAGQRLAQAVGAEILMILTDVPQAIINYGKPNAQPLGTVRLQEMEQYLREGHFAPGSMGPKVEACLRHVRAGGQKAIITSLDRAADALLGQAGTHIIPN